MLSGRRGVKIAPSFIHEALEPCEWREQGLYPPLSIHDASWVFVRSLAMSLCLKLIPTTPNPISGSGYEDPHASLFFNYLFLDHFYSKIVYKKISKKIKNQQSIKNNESLFTCTCCRRGKINSFAYALVGGISMQARKHPVLGA